MTADHATESPAAAGTRVLLETTRATWRFTAIRGLVSIGAFEQLAGGPLTTGGLYGYLATRPATAAGFDALVKGTDAPAASARARRVRHRHPAGTPRRARHRDRARPGPSRG
jgi:hypothetical protein